MNNRHTQTFRFTSFLLVTFFLLLSSTSILHAQSYNQVSDQADGFYNKKEYEKAIPLYEQASTLGQGGQNAAALYNAACCYALIQNKEKAIEFLNKSVENGWDDFGGLVSDTDLSALRTSSDWNTILAILYEKAAILDESPSNEYIYEAARAWAASGNKEKALKNIEIALQSGNVKMESLTNTKEFQILHNEPQWNQLVSNLNNQLEKGKGNFYWGIYFGILFFIGIYNFCMFFSLKERSFLYYSLFIIAYLQFEANRTDVVGFYVTDLFFWTKYLNPASSLGLYIILFALIFLLLFTKKFLNLKAINTKLDKWGNGIIIFLVILILPSYFIDILHRIIVFPIILFVYLFAFILGIYAYIKGFKPARFFVLGMGILTLTVFWVILSFFGFIGKPIAISVFHMDHLGTIFFSIIFSLAIGDKINILKTEKENAQEKALEVLEEKVQERTAEVVKQKHEVEEKQKEIIASINYAKRIQTSLLPTETYIQKTFKRLRK